MLKKRFTYLVVNFSITGTVIIEFPAYDRQLLILIEK